MAGPLSLATALMVAPMTSSAGYLTDSQGSVVRSGYGLCWEGIWSKPDFAEECGDKAPMAPAPAPVDGDADGDGVKDSKDKCPNTRPGAKVNADGCEIIDDVTINLVNDEFDFDSSALKDAMKSALDGIISMIKGTAGSEKLSVVGYTDSSGPEAYNQGLSERRAQSVADYMSANGVSASDMTVSGNGEANPVADNSTRDGRKKNRRVEIKSN